MSTELTTFHFEDDGKSFEEMGKPNGIRAWAESDLQAALGYQASASFRKVITRAMQACLTLGIATEDNFIRTAEGGYKLTRFACYLVAMNADNKKPQVAAAQLYFAAIAETFQSHLDARRRHRTRDGSAGACGKRQDALQHGKESWADYRTFRSSRTPATAECTT